MSSINQILNTALEQTILNENNDNTGGGDSIIPGWSDALKAEANKLGKTGQEAIDYVSNKAKEYYADAKAHPYIAGGGAAAALGAGLGAVLLAKKLRKNKNAAKTATKK
jgi:hypothetical protein